MRPTFPAMVWSSEGEPVNRRQFVSTSGAAAVVLGTPGVASSAGTKPVLMKVGCQSAPTNEAHLKYFARFGVKNICGYPQTSDGNVYATVEELSRMKDLAGQERYLDRLRGAADSDFQLHR